MTAWLNFVGRASSLPNRWQIILALAALTGLVALPLLLYGPPMVVDAPNHYYRLVELNWHVGQGDFYPRWFSHINHGYGGPLLNFYPPLSYYTALLLHLGGLPLPAAFVGSFVLATAIAVVGMYAWVSDHFQSTLAGIAAAMVYTLSPYFYYNILVRGALPEAWGLAFAPWLFWALHRFLRAPSKKSYIALVVLGAALLLSHALIPLLVAPVCLVYALLLLRQFEQPAQRLKWLIVAALHLAALIAFFLLPFFLESGWVGLNRAALHYQDFFIPLTDLFSRPIPFDPNLARNPFPLAIPLVPLLGSVVGLTLVVVQSRNKRPELPQRGPMGVEGRAPKVTSSANHHLNLFLPSLFTLLLLYGFLTLSTSEPLWQALPVGNLIQFPWRFLGPLMLMLAWLCGAAIVLIKNRIAVFVFVAASLLFGLTWSYRYATEGQYPASGQPVDVLQYEIDSPVSVGLTFQQEFRPKWAAQFPPADSLLAQYTANPSPARLQPLPPDVKVINQDARLTSSTLEYDSPHDVEAIFNLLYFPGWSAEVDGQSLAVEPTGESGLIHLNLPAGHHTLQLALRPTSAQLIGLLISLISFISLFFLRPTVSITPQSASVTTPVNLWPYIALFSLLLLARGTILEWWDTPFKHTRLNQIPAPLASPVAFGDQLALLGTDGASSGEPMVELVETISPQPADQPIRLTLYWQALANLTDDYHISLQLVDAEGNRFGLSDQYPGLIPTGGWQQGQYLPDLHAFTAHPGTPPGDYRLLASVYRLENGAANRLSWSAGDGSSGIEYEAARITLLPGWYQASDQLQITQAALATTTVGVGDSLAFTLSWLTGPSPQPGLNARFTLTDLNGSNLFSTDFPPAGLNYLSGAWPPNELIQFPQTILLPPDLPAGEARASLLFIDVSGQPASAVYEMGTVTITVPDRTFDLPPISHPLDYVFADSIRLLGYDLNGEALTLYWQAVEPVSVPLTVYVHDFNASGDFVGGHDSPPARSVTSWLPGEIITDVRPLPTGDYFEIGLYNSLTGARFGDLYTARP